MVAVVVGSDIKIFANIPVVQGLVYRRFRGETDYAAICDILQSCKGADRLEQPFSLEGVALEYNHLHNCDPYQDMLFAEVKGEAVGYTRGWWNTTGDGEWLGFNLGAVKPGWRGRGIGRSLLSFMEQHLRSIAIAQIDASQFSAAMPHFYVDFCSETETAKSALLERAGYRPVRYGYLMVRADLEDIPEAPMPPGLEVRPVLTEHYRLIWDASNEAFRDHWSYIPEPEEEYQRSLKDPNRDPSLWKVAWDGDQVAGMVLSFIDKVENAQHNRKRGYTENICVRRQWRKRGLARSLIVQSLHALKGRGMTEAAMGVDTQNISGALHLYESVGFHPVRRDAIYNKVMELK